MKVFRSSFLKFRIVINILLLSSINVVINEQIDKCEDCTVNDEYKCTCDGVNCKCDINNCKPNKYNKNNKCYDCSNVFSLSNSRLYSIENEECKSKTTSNCNKIIIETNQCVDECFSFGYESGDYCYQNCGTFGMEPVDTKKCQCNSTSYFKEEIIEGKKYQRCLELCPSGYYEKNTRKCVNKCEGETNRITENNGCTDLCSSSEFLYNQTQIINGELITKLYCLTNCPAQARFYYNTNLPYKERECLTECNKGHFYSIREENRYECLENCDYMTYIDLNSNIFQCTEKTKPTRNEYKCNDVSFPYQYQDSCLRNCEDTKNLSIFNNKETYFFINQNNKKFCSEECIEGGEIQFLDLDSLSCYQNCNQTSNKFHLGNKCLNSCDKMNLFHLFDTGKCVSECKDDVESEKNYYLLMKEKTCYEDCPIDYDYKYIDNETNECNTCKIPKNPERVEYGEGYIIERNELLYCSKNCSEHINDESKNYFHRNNDNKCITDIEKCEENNDEYKYEIGEEQKNYICYTSCNEIPGNYIYQYGYKCYSSIQPNNNIFYNYFYKESGINKYLKKEVDINEEKTRIKYCSKLGLYYTKGNECIKECNSGEYRILFSLDENGNINKLGECFESSCKNSTFNYLTKEKICYATCPYKSLVKIKEDGTNDILNNNIDVNCVIQCPSSFPYHSEDEKYCYDICPDKFYIENNGIKKCVNNCKDYSKYYFNDTTNYEIKCIDNCQKQINGNIEYYYFNNNNECLESCIDNEENENDIPIKFAIKADISPQPCIKECPGKYKYYYESDKICLSQCYNGINGYIKIEGKNECHPSCDNNQFVTKETTCSDKCSEDEPFFAELVVGGIHIKKCTSNCEKENSIYKFFHEYNLNEIKIYECLPFCPKDLYEFGKQCVEDCPKGFYKESNKCRIKCENKPYYRKTNNGDYECTDNCEENEFISSLNECVLNCSLGENFIGAGNRCKSECDPYIDGEFYTKLGDNINNEGLNFSIFKCVQKCEQNFILLLDETKECVTECPSEKPYKSPENICYSLCLKSDKYPFSDFPNCINKCPPEKYYQEDKICVDECNGYNYIINKKDNSCVNKCDINSAYRYEINISDTFYCVDTCSKYTFNNYKCYENTTCPKPFNFIVGNNECRDKCPENQYANPKDDNEVPNEYECKDSCDSKYFYDEKEKICRNNCKIGYFQVQYTQKCIESCKEISNEETPYYIYIPKDENSSIKKKTCVKECPTDKPFKDIDSYCSEECKFNGYKYYLNSNKTCSDKCPDGYKKNGFECVLNCPQNEIEKKYLYLDESDNCIKDCSLSKLGYIYFYKIERKCINKCNENDYIYDNNECVSNCPEEKQFIYNQKCIESCPQNQKYYIDKFEHGETVLKKFCLVDCPLDYQFFILDNENNICRCLSSCPNYYITNRDPKVIGKQCVENCENENKFYVKYNETHSECFDVCPNEKRYYIKSEDDINNQCFEKCNSSYPYHKKDSYECIKNCDTQFANYVNGECVSDCNVNNYYFIIKTNQDNEQIKLCLDNCSIAEYEKFRTPEGQCVKECDESKGFRGIRKNNEYICECINLFYYDDNGKLKCFNSLTEECGKDDAENYPIQINSTRQCIKNCFGILSPSEDICYLENDEIPNIICPENTEKGIFDNKLKCECKYKYYYNAKEKKICLSENENCPSNYNYLIPETNKCVEKCDGYKIIFDNKCLNFCPYGMIEELNSCKCSKFWYKESDNKYTCIEECNDNFPYIIEDTNECIKNCSETNYNILYGNKCLLTCGNNMDRVELDSEFPTYNISKYTCKCKNIWAEGGKCEVNSETNCTKLNINLKYLVRNINECVKVCPSFYKYYFNNDCFSKCEEGLSYGLNLRQKNNTYECECVNNWKYNENNLIECVEECDENEIVIEKTRECIKKDNFTNCPLDSPYLFNRTCYINCPKGTSIDNIKGNSCKCNMKWFKLKNDLVFCIEDEEIKCPYNTHPYYIYKTKECVKDKEDCFEQNYTKIFNYICYNNCPYLTKEKNNENNICECDYSKFYWYSYKDSEELRDYLSCGVIDCSETNKPYYINGTNECVSKCSDIGLYEYSKICYKKCPLLTKENKNDYICEFSTESESLKDLVGNITEKIVDIYSDLPDGGLVINNEDASLQIYGLNKNKDSIIRTHLAYMDLSRCIEKIYKSNGLDNADDIVVVKLDLKSKNKKLIINPVEYEFIDSKTGKILDASVCEKNELVISYPITYLLKHKNKLRNLDLEMDDEEEILQKFNLGKMINEKDNSIDTFNFNSSIYSDICIPVEIEGKDLVLEDRINYLFPNYSFCESICIYDYTDFVEERIYCNCSIKSGIDIDRPQNIKIYQINKNETDNNQKGPTNIPVLKCISKAKILNNDGFYFCIIFILAQIGLLLVTIFYGISSLINKIKTNVINNKDEENNNYFEYNETENNKIKDYKNTKIYKYKNYINNTKKDIKSSERDINTNPPKRKSDIEEDEDKKNEENSFNVGKIKYKPELKEKNLNFNEKNNYDLYSENNMSEINKYLQKNEIETEMGFLYSMKKEEKLIKTKYEYSKQNDKFDSMIVVLTSIFDKIYLIKILLLSDKYDIIPLKFSLYLLYHMLLVTFLAFFYDIKTIKNIWNKDNYPNINYYLLYGFIANIIVWVIYRIFCCLLNNDNKIKKLKNINDLDKERKQKRFNKYVYDIKKNIIIYYVIQFILILFCSFYLITFCGIYLGTQKKIFQSYGIAFVEIIIIKIVYGLILGILRKVSLLKENKTIYNISFIFNKYIS